MSGWSDGFLRAFVMEEGKGQIWEIANAHRGSITTVHADANYILTGGAEGAVRVWSRAQRQMLLQFNDQKKDIVSVFPDYKLANMIHSCSVDRSVCTYDLKHEKRINWRQTANGQNCGMA